MPDKPEGSDHKAYGELLHLVKDHERWHRVADEIAHRATVMGQDAAEQSVLSDVHAGRL